MRSHVLALTLLAGLLAVATPPASALCADDGQGGCSRLHHAVTLEARDGCPADEPLCIVDVDGNLSSTPNDADLDVRLANHLGSAVTLELFAIRFYDVADERVAPVLLGRIEVAAGGSGSIEKMDIPGNVSHLRVQVLSADGHEAEVDQELMAIRALAFGDGPADSGMADEPADSQPDGEKKDAPALPLAGLLLAGVAALLVARRVR